MTRYENWTEGVNEVGSSNDFMKIDYYPASFLWIFRFLFDKNKCLIEFIAIFYNEYYL